MQETPDFSRFAQRLGGLLRGHRGRRNQAEIALAIGIAAQTYSDYERGRTVPSIPMLWRLIRLLEIDPADVVALFPLLPVPNGDDEAAA